MYTQDFQLVGSAEDTDNEEWGRASI